MKAINRRKFTSLLGSMALVPTMQNSKITPQKSAESLPGEGSLADVAGLKVGHFTDSRRPTGCTVVLAESGATAGVDVRGAAPGTRETDLLNPVNTIQKVHAVLLTGGSAFGLDAASGVMQYLEEKGIGVETAVARVPIVPAAVLFDLGVGDARIRPDKAAGYAACRSAGTGPVPEGNVGAGAGATVGKLFGIKRAMKGGIGSASIRIGDLVVAALVAVNAVGDVLDPQTGKILAGARAADGRRLVGTIAELKKSAAAGKLPGFNSTIGVIATNAAFDKAGMTRIAMMGHDGLARAINPTHTPMDGDTLFALSTNQLKNVELLLAGPMAAEVVSRAIVRAILQAESIPGFPCSRELSA